MDNIFMNYKNSETSELHRLLLNLTDLKEKKNLEKVINILPSKYQTTSFTIP